MERRAAEELTEKGGWRNLVDGDWVEIFQESEKPVGIAVLLHIVRHLTENWFSIFLHHT